MYKINNLIKIFLVFLLIVIFFSYDSPKLNPIKTGGTILAFGDSLTVGVGTTKANSYPSVLANLSGLKVINSGVSGETSDMGLKRLPNELDRVMPDLLILIEGGNDILRKKSQSNIKRNIAKMIKIAKKRDIQVVLIGIPNISIFSSSAVFYKELAEEFELVFDDSLIADLQHNTSLKSDRIHFNKDGYKKMAESIYELLKDSGAL